MVSRSQHHLRKGLRISHLALSVPILVGAVALLTGRGAHAEGAEADKAEANERCAIRLSIALQGKSSDAALLAAADPQSAVDSMVDSPELAERYARFINSEMNGGPSASATERTSGIIGCAGIFIALIAWIWGGSRKAPPADRLVPRCALFAALLHSGFDNTLIATTSVMQFSLFGAILARARSEAKLAVHGQTPHGRGAVPHRRSGDSMAWRQPRAG